jgi:2-dehydropantoate 2-reductase
MKILFYGAGVIGSIYSAKLYKRGIDVTLLARGKRYGSLKQNGVIINDVSCGEQIVSKLPLIQQLSPDDFYDLIIVTVRLDQLDSIKTSLKQNTACRAIMFMLNNPDNSEQLRGELFGKNIILGFPGAGGTYSNDQIDYVQIKEQKTTIGDIGGRISDFTKDTKEF